MKTLFTPGPVALHPYVINSINQPFLHHRTPAFQDILKEVQQKLQTLFGTSRPVIIHSSSGTGAMESTVAQITEPGDKVLVISCGKFGKRWAKIAKIYKCSVYDLSYEPNQAFPIDDLVDILQNQTFSAVFTQATETSTGTLIPIDIISSAVPDSANLVVDAITCAGAYPLPQLNDSVDVLIGGSQKGFMGPPGASFIALSDKAMLSFSANTRPKYYFDWSAELKALQKNTTAFTTPILHIMALNGFFKYIDEVGIDTHYQIVTAKQQFTIQMSQLLGLPLLSNNPSPSVTALLVPQNIDSEALRLKLEEEYGFVLAGGQDHFTSKILRVGHIGYHERKEMGSLFKALHQALSSFGYQPPISENELSKEMEKFEWPIPMK